LLGEPFLIPIMAVVFASLAWSISPDQTMRRAVAVGFTTLCGVTLGSRWRWSTLTEIIAVTFAILAVSSFLTALLTPSLGRMQVLFPGAWRGLWPEKNALGEFMTWGVLACAAAAVMVPKRAPLWWGMAGLALLLILLSTSKTSLVALALGLGAFGLVTMARRGGAVAVGAVYVAVLAAVGLGAGIALAPDVFLGLLGKDATLTGRTKIWAAVIRAIQGRPWLGYGYGAVWTDDTSWGPLSWIVKWAGFKPAHAHDSWLEQWLGLGRVGLAAWALYFLTALGRAIWSMFRSQGALIALPFMVVYALVSVTESIAVSYNDLRWVLLVTLSARLAAPEASPFKPRTNAALRPTERRLQPL
jgi:exopolysaccharide production protein ExoQ